MPGGAEKWVRERGGKEYIAEHGRPSNRNALQSVAGLGARVASDPEQVVKDIGDALSPETDNIDEQLQRNRSATDKYAGLAAAADNRNTAVPLVAPGQKFNRDQTDQSRGLQVGGLTMAANAAAGRGPSGAMIQSRVDQDRAMRNAMGLAAANQGRSVGGALTAAQTYGSRAAADIGAQAMAERAREMAVARGQFIQGAQGLRTADTDLARTIADLRLRAAQGDQDARIRLQQLDDQFALGRGDQEINLLGNESNAAIQRDAIANNYKGGLIGGIGSAAATVYGAKK